jgi:hypothetical protein
LINLLDQDSNNLYIYQSEIAQFGFKKFILSKHDASQYMIVISSRIRDHLIRDNIFTEYEVHQLLYTMQKLTLHMRIPDLEFVITNDFEHLKQKYFF